MISIQLQKIAFNAKFRIEWRMERFKFIATKWLVRLWVVAFVAIVIVVVVAVSVAIAVVVVVASVERNTNSHARCTSASFRASNRSKTGANLALRVVLNPCLMGTRPK